MKNKPIVYASSPTLVSPMRGRPLPLNPGLSPKEKMILDLYLNENTAKEIAYELGISIKTVYTHKYRFFKKFKTRNFIRIAYLLGFQEGLNKQFLG